MAFADVSRVSYERNLLHDLCLGIYQVVFGVCMVAMIPHGAIDNS